MRAPIGRDLARDVERALRALLEWKLPPEAWDETGQMLAELGTAVDQGDATQVDALTARLETSGRRARRLRDSQEPADGKSPAPQPIRERAVAILHALEQPPAPARPGGGAPESASRPSGK